MKILITGDRNWTDEAAIEQHLAGLGATEIIEGEARGADTLARIVAERRGWKIHKFPADWETHGKAAGPIRNDQMLKENPDLVVAFHDSLATSKGTGHCVKRALAKKMVVYLVNHVHNVGSSGCVNPPGTTRTRL